MSGPLHLLRGVFMARERRECELEQALHVCLTEVRAGRSPDQAVARFPHLREELAPLVELAAGLSASAAAVGPSPAFRAAARARLMHVARESAAPRGPRTRLAAPAPRWAPSLAAMLAGIALAGNLTLAAAAEALPGDLLYPVKLLAEQADLVLARDEEARRDLQLRVADARLREAVALAERGQPERAAEAASAYARAVEALVPSETEVEERVAKALSARLAEHQSRLSQVLGRAPEPARPALEQALQRSRRGLERALEVHTAPAANTPATEPTRQTEPPGRDERPPRPGRAAPSSEAMPPKAAPVRGEEGIRRAGPADREEGPADAAPARTGERPRETKPSPGERVGGDGGPEGAERPTPPGPVPRPAESERGPSPKPKAGAEPSDRDERAPTSPPGGARALKPGGGESKDAPQEPRSKPKEAEPRPRP